MKNSITELVFILDRSGSMSGLEADTIGGFNAMIEKQKAQEGQCFVSTVLFSNDTQVLHDRIPLEQVQPLTTDDYHGVAVLFGAFVGCYGSYLFPYAAVGLALLGLQLKVYGEECSALLFGEFGMAGEKLLLLCLILLGSHVRSAC